MVGGAAIDGGLTRGDAAQAVKLGPERLPERRGVDRLKVYRFNMIYL